MILSPRKKASQSQALAKPRKARIALWGAVGLCLILAALAAAWWRPQPSRIALLVPQSNFSHPITQIWLQAAREQGLPVELLSADGWLRQRLFRRQEHPALIVPDTVFTHVSPPLVLALQEYVMQGGQLALVYDAGTRDINGAWRSQGADFSSMLGLRYGLYEQWRGKVSTSSKVIPLQAASALKLPPGRISALDSSLNTYGYTDLLLPVLQTEGHFEGSLLIRTPEGAPVWGERRLGKGLIHWVNLPLGQLKAKTDGWLLHRLLRRLAETAGTPTLAMTPQGRGHLLINLHVDSGLAIPALERLEAQGFLNLGTTSIHLTAGPDVDHEGDGKGMDLAKNLQAQKLARRLSSQGHDLGSHGGWYHNIWGQTARSETTPFHRDWLEWNHRDVGRVRGSQPRSFSAPVGNQPQWVTEWLASRGIRSYYSTANLGSAPTRAWHDGDFDPDGVWSYPVNTMGPVATFEDAYLRGIDDRALLKPWLFDLSRWVAKEREARLVYFHPPGILLYPNTLAAWQDELSQLIKKGQLRLARMDVFTDFLNRQQSTQWSLERSGSAWRLQANNPQGLHDLTWRLPKSHFAAPKLEAGSGAVESLPEEWLLHARAGHTIRWRFDSSSPASAPN